MSKLIEDVLGVIQRNVAPAKFLTVCEELAGVSANRGFRETLKKAHDRALRRYADPMSGVMDRVPGSPAQPTGGEGS